MATINISDLRSAGFELFSDSESYLHQLTDEEKYEIQGGVSPAVTSSVPCVHAARVAAQSSGQCAVAAGGLVERVIDWF